MSDRVEAYLFTDPFYEKLFHSMRKLGYSVSHVTQDEWYSTCQVLGKRVHAATYESPLGSLFRIMLDKQNMQMLVTTEVPEGFKAPLENDKSQQLALAVRKNASLSMPQLQSRVHNPRSLLEMSKPAMPPSRRNEPTAKYTA